MQNKTINTVEDIDYLIDEISYVAEDFDIAEDEYNDSNYDNRVQSKLNLLTVLRDCISQIDYIVSTYKFANTELQDIAKDRAEEEMLDYINRACDYFMHY